MRSEILRAKFSSRKNNKIFSRLKILVCFGILFRIMSFFLKKNTQHVLLKFTNWKNVCARACIQAETFVLFFFFHFCGTVSGHKVTITMDYIVYNDSTLSMLFYTGIFAPVNTITMRTHMNRIAGR